MSMPDPQQVIRDVRKNRSQLDEVWAEVSGSFDANGNARRPGGQVESQPGSNTSPVVAPITNSPGTMGPAPAIPGSSASPAPTSPQFGLSNFIKSIADYITGVISNIPATLSYLGFLPPGDYNVDGKTYHFERGQIKPKYIDNNPPSPGQVAGSTDPYAINYNPSANVSDGSEEYPFTGNPGPYDSRNTSVLAVSYGGGIFSPNMALFGYKTPNDTMAVPYYPFSQSTADRLWNADGGVYGQNNAYYEDGNPTTTQQERKGLIDDFLKSTEYSFFPPTHLFQERQDDLPVGFSNDSNMIYDYLNGALPRNTTDAKPAFNFNWNNSVYRKLELRANDVYNGATGGSSFRYAVINPANRTWRPAEPTSWYTALTGSLANTLRGCNQANKSSNNAFVKEIFAFSDSRPMTGYSVYKNGLLLSDSQSITATYDNTGTNKITIFDFNCVTRFNPISIRTQVDSLSSLRGIPPLGNFIINNDIDQGKFGTFLIMQHNTIQSLNIARPFYLEYCNAYFPAFSGKIYIQ